MRTVGATDADRLAARLCAFSIFLTGYDDADIIPVDLRPVRRLGKPILGQQLIDVLTEII